MEFILRDIDHSIQNIEDLCGYTMSESLKKRLHHDQLGLVRMMNIAEYPKFYLTVEILNGGGLGHKFNLWLERSSNPGHHINSGEEIEKEMERIKSLLA